MGIHNRKSEPHPDAKCDTEPLDGDDKQRHSVTELFRDPNTDEPDARPSRKFHSKSFSLSENRIAAVSGSNLFQQNRELWEKRAELQSQQCLTSPRILSRNRIAPDLVMDLPFPVSKDGVTHSSRESLDSEAEDLTSAERFAAPNQCTLKKNERFSADSYELKKEVKLDFAAKMADKPKAEVRPQELCTPINTGGSDSAKRLSGERLKAKLDDVLHIDEEPMTTTKDMTATTDKSPIPARNTKKFVTQFADLKLTGGCLSSQSVDGGGALSSQSSTTSVLNSGQQTLSSFKPQVKVKPQLMKKPLVLPPTTPEMSRRNQE